MSIVKDQQNNLDSRVETRDYSATVRRFSILLSIPFLLLVGRLWYLQIWMNEHYEQLAFNNFIDRSSIAAERGLIFDSKGRLVAGNRPSYDVFITPAYFAPADIDEQEVNEQMATLRRFLALTEEESQAVLDRVNKSQDLWRYQPILLKRNITRDQVARIETNAYQLHGVNVQASSQRYYPFNDLAAHVLGYVNEINSGELERLELYGYRPGEVIGRTGLERSLEAILRGAPGVHAEVVNSRGMPQTDDQSRALLGDWQDVQPIPGKNIVLSLDMDLQRIIKTAMRDYETGAAVALDPRTGAILGIASKPAFNPNAWSGRLSRDEHIDSDNNPHEPMLDKSLLAYFPGSVYKVISAAAALEAGLITKSETLHCPGYYEYGKQKRRFHCWKRSGHDSVTLAQALQMSCDVYFYKVGEKLGMDKLGEYARMFGFGSRSGIGINIESPGLVPTKEWHAKFSPEGFQGGFTLSTAIGQGDTRTSPLQMALAYAALANRGTLYYPQLIKRIETPTGQILFEYPVRIRNKLDLDPATIDEIIHGLDLVVNHEEGTAYATRLDYVRVAGKTGTAQVTSKRVSNSEVEFDKRDHAWFASFAPVDDPEIVVVVFLEHGGGGSSDAAPVAMEILDRYFREIRGYDPMQMKPKEREPKYLVPADSASRGRGGLLSEPGSHTPRWRD